MSPSIVITFPDSVALVYVPPSILLIKYCIVPLPCVSLPANTSTPVLPTSTFSIVPEKPVGVSVYNVPLKFALTSVPSTKILLLAVPAVAGIDNWLVNVLSPLIV